MSTIIITPRRVKIADSEGRSFIVRYLALVQAGTRKSLHDGRSFADIEPLEFRLAAWWWSNRLPVPHRVLKATEQFLIKHQGQDHSLDCYDFACMANDIPMHDKKWLFAFWNERSASRRKPGDTVMLIDKEHHMFHHAAVYLGRGLYLSVYGHCGDLEVSTLEDMRRSFNGKDVITVIPRSE